MTRKIALAYSGGLDTSVIIPWLKENYDCEVIAVCGDVGQEADYEPVKAKALASGAAKCYVGHLTEEYVADYIFPASRPALFMKASTCSVPLMPAPSSPNIW